MYKNIFLFVACLATGWLVSCQPAKQSTLMSFSSQEEKAAYTWALSDLAPGFPDDWSDYNFLVLELNASSPQRFYVGPVTSGGLYAKSVQPFPGAKIRFSIPLEYYRELPVSAVDMAATYNKARALGQVNIHHTAVGPLTGIDSICFYMHFPVNNPTLELFSVSLAKDDPGDRVLQDGYLVDAFGLWAVQTWPGKVKTQEELTAAWKQEDANLQPLLPDVSQYGGYKAKQLKATGFFRTEKMDGKWWLVDPEGYLFLSVGVDCMGASVRTSTKGREYIFENLQDTSGNADYYKWNLQQRYGDKADTEWVNTAVKRMHAWGLNTIANWSSSAAFSSNPAPFVLSVPGLQLEKGIMGLPDIYDPQYAEAIDKSIGGMADKYKDNPWLLGYFVGNEQPWPGQESILCDRILNGNDRPIKTALQAYIQVKGESPEAKRAFVYETFGKFLGQVNSTLKKHDPHHLNLGMRFGGETSSELLAIIGKHFDVFSFNCYALQPSEEFMKRIDEQTGLPVLVGEYHFGVPDRGMAAGIVQVATRQDRGKAYRYYNEQGYAHPSLVGAHWFQWIDQPNTGRGDGENYNIGLLDITDRPYPDMVEAMQATHKRLYDIHSGTLAPYSDKPATTSY
jgi:hypothetical protein